MRVLNDTRRSLITATLRPAVLLSFLLAVGCSGDGVGGESPSGPDQNAAPSVTISSPSEDASYTEGEQITFEGSADDPEDGSLTGSSLTWTSHVDGELGTGQTVTVSSLSIDTHTVSLAGTDSEGGTDEDSVELTVEVNEPPEAAITTPSQDTTVQEGDTISFHGAATDPNETRLTNSSMKWSSGIDGTLGNGPSVDATLTPDTVHTVVFAVADPQGATDTARVSVTVEALTDWTDISAGGANSCGLDQNGTAYCWGNGTVGALGIGSFVNRRTSPVRVAIDSSFTQITVDGGHACGVTPSGAAYCWGHNAEGDLGDGTTTNRPAPVRIAPSLTFAQIDAGQDYTCGVTKSGMLYCWGENLHGQLGDGTTTSRLEPVLVADTLTFTQVKAGPSHTCGLGENGDAYCWGANGEGQLGDGTTTERHEPGRVSGGYTFTDLAVNRTHSCGVTTDGTAYCWGDNTEGELGDGTGGSTDAHSTVPVAVSGGYTFDKLSAGADHTCGITTGGTLYCWGSNDFDVLGDGSYTEQQLEPSAVALDEAFLEVSGSDTHTCGRTADMVAYCWGNNSEGQIGIGTVTGSEREPERVLEP